jgi:hypothetical protein
MNSKAVVRQNGSNPKTMLARAQIVVRVYPKTSLCQSAKVEIIGGMAQSRSVEMANPSMMISS